ncbi:SLAM family member 9 [Dissostichus eleginoides]|uniref:SLAM family member 9 n=1 Tax=Dissostichus eleginoides TaxID=100907 RepID=A0AAD9EZB1_DISEL|nr:SLAM family member 9 [Dissostichus eleginoides]
MFIFVILGLLVCTEAREISAGAPVFVLKGEDVHLNNLQEADSGVYTAVLERVKPENVAEYNVKVQDRASPPLLTVSSVSDSSSSCSFTVTCSSQDSHINSTFTCDNQTCSQEGGERNHVSWTNNTLIINDVCHQHDDPEGLSVCLVKTCVLSVGLIIMVSAVITIHLMEKLNKNK